MNQLNRLVVVALHVVTRAASCSTQQCCAGKTTLLRDVVSVLANTFNKRVVVVDTSNEIGGDGAVPHSCLGRARRMPVHDLSKQHEVLLQAVQNHNPQVICAVACCCEHRLDAAALHLQSSAETTFSLITHAPMIGCCTMRHNVAQCITESSG